MNVSTDGGSLATFFVLCGTQEGEWTRRPNVRKAVGNAIIGAHSPDAAEGKKVNCGYGQCIQQTETENVV